MGVVYSDLWASAWDFERDKREERWNWAARASAAVACVHWLSFQMCGDILKECYLEITTMLWFWVIVVLDLLVSGFELPSSFILCIWSLCVAQKRRMFIDNWFFYN